MKLTLQDYEAKLRGCWIGKNIGGTLGAPFECKRGVFHVDFYTQELHGEPLPNDDLDLQLVWLNVAEKYGRGVTASILGEYWLTFIVPNWGEYGAGKNNMRQGIVPPLSGYVNNVFRDSNGAYIRSEIWACLAPGHPEIAVKYAYEDAIVDHSHEGVYAEVFFAAVQSAAFVESDTFKLIDIGLSYIPEESGVARGIGCVVNAYRSGLTWQDARLLILNELPGSFGVLGMRKEDLPSDVPVGPIGYDAPSNVGITILGWLYGEGDFGESICIATNCGEDTDCTAATIGSIMGIIGGVDNIPQKWKEPIGDSIKTLCINLGDQGIKVPKSVTELTDRIVRLAPAFLGSAICDVVNTEGHGYTIEMNDAAALYHKPIAINAWTERSFKNQLDKGPFVVPYNFVIFKCELDYGKEPYVGASQPITLKLNVDNELYMQQWIQAAWYLPDGWRVSQGRKTTFSLEHNHCNIGSKQVEFTIIPSDQLDEQRYDLVLELSSHGRHTKGLIPITLIHSL
ncbi:ADP-ribosylglycohydrolase family protein [Paenibacillus qinlingensis]|uniref:ADP-ribosylglycohydrolase family protein n=1 Tax=Paenibacillus qinlingensis TaxID=1837343 RepID=A0ABU1NS55_9BACL|nr:ADP-ribosylglycohydrolase family protein [Paenibacillus qinlingensis]MDR6550317.1 hypothetical protein [Paenibacillus qinlingensis]